MKLSLQVIIEPFDEFASCRASTRWANFPHEEANLRKILDFPSNQLIGQS
jgi:hypothetical protein